MFNKPNDWIAANLNAPEGSTIFDMRASGILPDNTIIQDRDYYKDIPQVQQAFQKNDGSFDENSFNEFYDSALRSFNTYSNEDFLENMVKQMDRSPYDWTKLDNPNVIDTSAYLSNIKDKNRTTMGTGNIWQIGDPVYSDREVAQANFVRDEFGNELDYTANDKGGFIKGLWMPTMALATWDEDGTHSENGTEVSHKKGDLKVDWKGDPYMELLGSKEAYDKDIVKWADVLTKEDSFLNKFDAFDSDGLEKSIGGTIAKTALKIAPYFIPYIGPYIGYAVAGKELLSVMPTVLKAANGIITNNNDNLFGKSMTKWENFMEKYSGSMSDAGKQSFWNFENIGDVVASSFGQLASQRTIAKIPKLLSNNTIKASKAGQELALSYMAITSAKDSYKSFKEAGAEDWVAGVGMLGTMGVYRGLMGMDYFKEWIFKDSWLADDVEFRKSFNKWISEYAKSLGIEYKTMNPKLKKILGNKVLNTIYTKGSDLWTKFAESGFGNALINGVAHSGLNEGIEEVTEEAASDLVKGLVKGMEAIGIKVSEDPTKKLDFGFSPEDFMQRYAASFVGGFVGGTVFKGYEFYENWQSGQKNISDVEDLNKRMAWYIRNGYYDKMVSTLDTMYKEGKLPANANLSFNKFADVDSVKDDAEFKERSYLPTKDPSTNHQKYLHDILKAQLSLNYNVLNEHILPISDQEITKKIKDRIQAEAAKEGLDIGEYSRKNLIDFEIEMMHELGYFNKAARDANEKAAKVFEAGHKLKLAEKRLETASESDKPRITKEVKQWKEVLDKHVKEYEAIVNGDLDAKYIAQAYYRTNNDLLSAYLNDDSEFKASSDFFPETNVRHFAKLRYDLDYDALDENVQKHIDGEFNQYQENKENFWIQRLEKMSELHYILSERFAKSIQSLSDQYKGYKTNEHFTDTYQPDFWKNIREAAKKYDENPEDFNRELAWLSQFDGKAFDKLTKDELSDLAEYINLSSDQQIDPENSEMMKQAYEEIQGMIHVMTNFDAYLKLSEVLGQGNVSVDQIMSKEGFEKWVEIFGIDARDDAGRRIQRQLIVDYYKNLKKNKIISSHESLMYKGYASDILKVAIPNIEKMIENFATLSESETGESYDGLASYDYSNDNGFFQSLMNSALGELREAIMSMNVDAIDAAIQKIRDIASNNNVVSDEVAEENEWGERLPDFDADRYMQLILAPIQDLIDFAKEISVLKKDVRESPVVEFLNKLSLEINGGPLNVLDVISNIENTLKLIDKIEDLDLGSQTVAELYASQNLLKIAASLIATSYKDPRMGMSLNDKINLFKKDNKFASTDNFILGQEIIRLSNKVNAIIDLIEQNVVSTVEEQKKIAANIFPKIIKNIVSPSVEDEDENLFIKELKEILKIESGNPLYDLWIEAGGIDLNTVSVENYKEFEQVVRKWQALVYERIVPKLTSIYGSEENVWKKIGEVFGEKFGKGLGNMKSTQMSSQTKQVSFYDTVIFFLTTIASDPKEFGSKYKHVVDKESSKEKSFLPYFSQELAVQIGYARTKNNDLFNGFISKLEKTSAKELNAEEAKYLKETSHLFNFMMVDGSAGSGKSTGFSYFLSEVLKLDGKVVVAASQLEERAKNLAKTLGVQHVSTETILDTIIKSKDPKITKKTGIYTLDGDHVKLDDSKFEVTTELSESLKTIFGNDLSKVVLFVDEITLLHSGKLRVLSEFAEKVGMTIIALGDSKQEDALYKENPHSIEDFIFIKAPKLQASLRITNKAKKKNRLVVESVLNEIDEVYSLYPEWSTKEMDAHIEDLLSKRASELVTLSYTKNSDGLFGEMYSNTPETHVDFLLGCLKEGETIGIIVDSESKGKYSKWADNPNVIIIDSSKVQGGEYTYTVVDINWNGSKSKRELLKKFNTLTSRSKVGTVIGYSEDNDVRKKFIDGKIIFDSTMSDSGHLSLQDPNSEANKAIREEYKAYKRDCLSDITAYVPSSESAPASSVSTPSSTPGTSSPGEKPIEQSAKVSKVPTFENKDLILKDDPEYKTRQGLLNSPLQNVVSEDVFFELVQKLDGTFLFDLMGISKMLPINKEVENERKLKRWIQIVSGFILNSHVDSGCKFTTNLQKLLKEFDPTKDGKLSSIFEKAWTGSDENASGYYYFAKQGDKSIIHYCIDTDEGTIAVPIGQTSKLISGTYKSLSVRVGQGPITVSSNGSIHTPIKEVIGDRFLYGSDELGRSMEFGIYAATSDSSTSKDFVKGKAFLPLFLPHQHQSARSFFRQAKNSEGVRDTQDLGWTIKVKKPGVQRIFSFADLFPAWTTLTELSAHIQDVVTDDAKMQQYKQKLDSIFSGASFLRPKTNDQKAVTPRNLVHASRMGQLFTAIFRYFYSDSSVADRKYFLTQILTWTEGSPNRAFEISIKTDRDRSKTKRIHLNGNNVVITDIATEKTHTFELSKIVENIEILLNDLFENDPNVIENLATDKYRITPVYKSKNLDKWVPAYDYSFFTYVIKNDKNLIDNISEFLEKDAYFKHQVYLNIYADSEFTDEENKIWKVASPKIDGEFVWDIVYVGLPIYVLESADNEIQSIPKFDIDAMWTPESVSGTEESHITIKSGTSFKAKNSTWYQILIGKNVGSISANKGWAKANLGINEDVEIIEFSDKQLRIKTKSETKTVDFVDFKKVLIDEGIIEVENVSEFQATLNSVTWDVTFGNSDVVTLKNGSTELKGTVIGVDKNDVILSVSTNDGYVVTRTKKPNTDKFDYMSRFKFVTSDSEYAYYYIEGQKTYRRRRLDSNDVFRNSLEEVPQGILQSLLGISSSAKYSDSASISKNGDVYTFNGISLSGDMLNKLIANGSLVNKQFVVHSFDFKLKKVKLIIDNKISEFELKSNITFEQLNLDSNKYKLVSGTINTVLENKVKKVTSVLETILNIADMTFEQAFGITKEDAIKKVTSESQFENILNIINKKLIKFSYIFGAQYQFKIDGSMKKTTDPKYEIGKILYDLDFEGDIEDISNITEIDDNTLKIKDFWVTLQSGKEHYKLTSKDNGPWVLEKVSEEFLLHQESVKNSIQETILNLVNSFNEFVNVSPLSGLGQSQMERIKDLISKWSEIILSGNVATDEMWDEYEEIKSELEESVDPNDEALLNMFDATISNIDMQCLENDMFNNNNCSI